LHVAEWFTYWGGYVRDEHKNVTPKRKLILLVHAHALTKATFSCPVAYWWRRGCSAGCDSIQPIHNTFVSAIYKGTVAVCKCFCSVAFRTSA